MFNIGDVVKEKLINFPNKSFILLINNKPINLGTQFSPRYVYAKYETTKMSRSYTKVGAFKKGNDGKLEIVETQGGLDTVNSLLNSTMLDNKVDLAQLIGGAENQRIQATVDAMLGVLAINTISFIAAKKLVSTMENSLTPMTSTTGEALDVAYTSRIYGVFTTYALQAYNELVSRVLLRKLKSSTKLKFYFTLDSFLPVLIRHRQVNSLILFNPYTDIKLIAERFLDSKLYDLKTISVETIGEYEVYFATSLEICKAFGLDRFVPFTTQFYLDILAGQFSNEFPNQQSRVFTYVGDAEELTKDLKPVYTESEFADKLGSSPDLVNWLERNYEIRNSLDYACALYTKQRKLGKGLRQIMESTALQRKE